MERVPGMYPFLGDDKTGDGSYEYPFRTVQMGIDEANPEDSVFIMPGTYIEHLDVFKPLYISSIAGCEFTVIEGEGNNREWGVIGWHGGKDDLSAKPTKFALYQNYPNPFNPVTTIRYALPKTEDVRLTVYNLLGQEVETLVDEKQSSGVKTVVWSAGEFSSGIYFYRLKAGNKEMVKRMVLLK